MHKLKSIIKKNLFLFFIFILLVFTYIAGITFVFLLLALLLALFIISTVSSRLMLAGLHIKRALPSSGHVLEEITPTYTLSKSGFLNRYFIEVEDVISCSHIQESYLLEKIDKDNFQFKGKTFHCQNRGVYQLDDIRLKSGFPFNLQHSIKTIKQEQNRLTVYPKLFELSPFILEGKEENNFFTNDAHAQGEMELVGVRDYQIGDSRSHVHWVASAKKRQLITKEFASQNDEEINDIQLLLNLQKDAFVQKEHFEMMLSFCASMAKFTLDKDVNMSCRMPQKVRVASQKSFKQLLETLAACHEEPSYDYKSLIFNVILKAKIQTLIICFIGDKKPKLNYHDSYVVYIQFIDTPLEGGYKIDYHDRHQVIMIGQGCDMEAVFAQQV